MNSALALIAPPAIAAILSFGLTPLVARLAVRVGAVDLPGERKIHGAAMPRLGGLAVITAIALVWGAQNTFGSGWGLPPHIGAAVALGVVPILAISLIDDLRPVSAHIKVLFHLGGAVLAVTQGVSLPADIHVVGYHVHLGWLALPISVVWIVGVTNAFNIIDGLDGLAAGLSLIAAASMAAVFALIDQPAMMAACLVLAGALAGFLPYNFYPARLFLGDTGATTIGFCLAVFALRGGSTLSTGFAALIPVFMMGLPIADTLIAMARRLLSRLERGSGSMFVADRNHIHHRLLALGVTHAHAVLLLYGAGMAMAAAGLISIFLTAREAALFITATLLAGVIGMQRLGYDEFAFIRRGTVLKAYETPVLKRALFVVFVDLAIALAATFVAVGLKSDRWNLADERSMVFAIAGTLAPLTVVVFWGMGIYRGSWRLAGIADLLRVCAAVAAVTMLSMITHPLWSPAGTTNSLFIIYGLVSLVLVLAARTSYVVLRTTHQRASMEGRPVIIYGAGAAGTATVRELYESRWMGLRPIGFVDDDPRKRHKLVHGLPVLGTSDDLPQLVSRHRPDAVLVAITNLPVEQLRKAAARCELLGIGLLRMQFTLERLLHPREPDALPPPAAPAQALEPLLVTAGPRAHD